MGIHITFTERDARRLLHALILVEILLVAIFVADTLLDAPVRPIHRWFDLDREANVPAWFSSVQLFSIGIVFVLITRRPDARDHPPRSFLLAAGCLFLFLSVDEAAAIHEQISTTLGRPDWLPSFEGKRGFWIPIYLFLLSSLLLAGSRGLRTLWSHFRREFLVMAGGLAVFLGGAAGLEIVSYEYLSGDRARGLYLAEVALEEFLEMLGASLILYGVVLLAIRQPQPLRGSAP